MIGFDAWREGGRRFAHHGHSIFWQGSERPDAGSALLCIHGFPTASWDWHALWPPLTQRFSTVLAPDLIGFGWSDKPRGYGYSIFDQADLCESLLRTGGVKRTHILAHDYGDTVAQELLARHEDRSARGDDSLIIESVCFLNGGLFPEAHRARLVQKLLLTPIGPLVSRLMSERAFRKSFSAIFGPRTKPSADELREFWQLLSHSGGTAIAHELIRYIPERRAHRARWVGAMEKTRVPLRLIDGAEDPVSGLSMAERYREVVPNSDVVLLPEIGHYPQIEHPEATLEAFLELHDRLDQRTLAASIADR
jgi:pimeloyl-ACP methyl ester carboxylesterase